MLFAAVLGKIIGFGIIIAIGVMAFKTRGTHPEIFELSEGEEIVKLAKGDWWQDVLIGNGRNTGEFAFTNNRVLFRTYSIFGKGEQISIPYSEIVSVKKSFVKIWPVAFTIKTINDESYKFAILKRQIYIDLIESLAKKSSDNVQETSDNSAMLS